ncbi:MAG: hypothetical protein RLZZ265_113 [Verrucomicrobiota bacterium]
MGAPQYEQAGADVAGSGTPGTIPVWSSGTTLGDSVIKQSGTFVGFNLGANAPLQELQTVVPNTGGTPSVADWLATYAANGDRRSGFGFNFSAVQADNKLVCFVSNGTTTGQTAVWTADGSGNVGIGTASPGAQLHVERAGGSSTNAEYLRLRNTTIATGSNASQSFFVNGNTVATGNISHAWNGTTYDTIFNVWNGSALAEAGRAIGGSTPVLSVPSGLKLPATPGNADTQTLDCYLDGGASGGATWAPVDNSGAGLTFTVTSARYMRIGRLVLASFDITFPATASGAQAKVSLPVTSQAVWQGASIGFGPNVPGLAAAVNNADVAFWTYGAATTNAALSGARLIVSMSYFAN